MTKSYVLSLLVTRSTNKENSFPLAKSSIEVKHLLILGQGSLYVDFSFFPVSTAISCNNIFDSSGSLSERQEWLLAF